ncbi:blast:Peptidyl-prolyl cis-trans isomerase D [Drosophila guanche]|uniref:Peptidyl-prolyl cis-trans isomerase n=1 Tax=Drosophila guanche TaxID=7266 RepID=A0A3B0K1T6_DROGU|nr:blast:Peptidyl-prolyl cis-trans isomerase D [Drosophila guanche]
MDGRKLLQPVRATNPIVFMDIDIGQEDAGRMVIELRKDVVPKTAENFRALCTGECGIGQLGQPLHYKGNRFHRIKRVFAAQSGDVVKNDGTSGESIYGPVFEDENFQLTHNEEGVVSMANYGTPNTNNSQFFVTAVGCENLNGINVVVGRVLRGLGVVAEMELNCNDEGDPTAEIVIRNCGELAQGEDWGIECSDETPDKLPPYPMDWTGKSDKYTVIRRSSGSADGRSPIGQSLLSVGSLSRSSCQIPQGKSLLPLPEQPVRLAATEKR